MNDRLTALLSPLALTAGASWLVVTAGAAQPAPATCEGKAVTVVATKVVTQGTEGDDVVAMEPGAWNTFDAKGGNDEIVVDDSWSARVLAGDGADRLWVSGDDVVVRGESGN